MAEVADMQKVPTQVSKMFDQVAARYDLTNLVMTFGQVGVWRRILTRAVNPQPAQKVLDVAAGTGTSSVILAQLGAQVTACDFSPGMVAEGKKRHPELNFVQADALNLPFADQTFDCVTCSFGLRNMQDTARAVQEFKRVTKVGGRLVIMEFSTPPRPALARAHRLYLESVLPLAGKLVSSDPQAYRYLMQSVFEWPDQLSLAYLLSDQGWEEVEYRNLTFGAVAIHRAYRPL